MNCLFPSSPGCRPTPSSVFRELHGACLTLARRIKAPFLGSLSFHEGLLLSHCVLLLVGRRSWGWQRLALGEAATRGRGVIALLPPRCVGAGGRAPWDLPTLRHQPQDSRPIGIRTRLPRVCPAGADPAAEGAAVALPAQDVGAEEEAAAVAGLRKELVWYLRFQVQLLVQRSQPAFVSVFESREERRAWECRLGAWEKSCGLWTVWSLMH